MKRNTQIIFYLFLTFYKIAAQNGVFVNGSHASLIVPNGSTLSIDGNFGVMKCDPANQVRFGGALYLTNDLICNDILKFFPDGNLPTKNCKLVFTTGIGITAITGTYTPEFWEIEVAKGIGNSIYLYNNIIVRDTLTFTSGFFYPNNRKVLLQDPVGAPQIINHPWIKAERYGTQFLAANAIDTGMVIYNTIYTSSLNFSGGNIGLFLSGPVNVGSTVKIKRGFSTQPNVANLSLRRYYEIESPTHSLTNNSLTVNYTLNDIANVTLQNTNLALLRPYFSNRIDINWTPTTFSLPLGPLGNSSAQADKKMTIPLTELRHKNMLADSTAFRIVIANPECSNPPLSALLPDTIHICSGDSIVLDAGNNGSVTGYNLRYAWSLPSPAYTRTLIAKPNTSHQKFKVRLLDARGCATFDSLIIAPQAPFPQINYLNYLNACLGDSITVKDSVTITAGTFTNVFGFSNSSLRTTNSKLFKHLLPLAGTYSVLLTSTSNHGCTSISSQTGITVYNLPIASFSTNYNCATKTVNFQSTSSANHSLAVISATKWKYNPTDSALGTSAIKTYSIAGSYSTEISVSTNFGCINTAVQVFTVYPFNQASFTKNNSCLGDTTFLKNTSTCLTGSCGTLWDLGDNTTSTLDSIKKVYSAAGLKTVWLKTTAPVGCTDSVAVPVFVNPRPAALFSLSSSTICAFATMIATNSSSISSGNIATLNWLVNNQAISQQWNSSYTPTIASTSTIELQLTSDSLCASSSAQIFTVHPKPNAQFVGNTVCEGSVSTFTALYANPGNSYSFFPTNLLPVVSSSVAQFSLTYTLPGAYSPTLILVDSNSCSDTATVSHQVLPRPLSPFSGSISTCGSQYSLDALNPGAIYSWSPGNQPSQQITCTQNGLYQVLITGTNACTRTSQVYLKLSAKVEPQLGNDTTVCGSIKLDAGYPGSFFLWNTGATTQTILATQSGNYTVNVQDQNNCSGSDTIVLAVLPVPLVNAGPNITTCRPSTALTITATGTANTYSWNTGQLGQTLQTITGGIYLVTGTATNGCTAQDTMQIQILTTPSVNLGGAKSACTSIVFSSFDNASEKLWNNGSTANSYTASGSEKIWLQLTNILTGCMHSDTSQVTIFGTPQPNLGSDTITCSAAPLTVSAGTLVGTFLWNTSATAASIIPQSSGLYGLTVTNVGGCAGVDYINITKINSPQVNLGSSIRYLCPNAPFVLSSNAAGNYLWKKNNQSVSTSSTINVEAEGIYKLTVSNSGCSASDSVLVAASNQTVKADFLAATIDTVNKSVKFVNLSKPAITYAQWDFGDGTSSTNVHPEHTWFSPTDYSVTLVVGNNFCTDKITKQLSVIFKNYREEQLTKGGYTFVTAVLHPNPTKNTFQLHIEIPVKSDVAIVITDVLGRITFSKSFESKIHMAEHFSLEENAAGIYFIKLQAQSAVGTIYKTLKVVKEN